ncbi:MAG: hypothetical protein NTX64_10300 [Elusimicrobia bacterium]|nr:hypothetical protein [Elusimicrobiota bacterium]
MKVECAWCRCDLGSRKGGAEDTTTSGICDSCLEGQLREFGHPLQKFLDEQPIPVVILGPDCEILGANRSAREIGQPRLPCIDDRFGEAIGCPNSKTTGCGRSVHCQSCTIRRSVKKTFETGDACLDVLAYPDVEIGSRIKHLKLRISTARMGRYVALQIEKVAESDIGFVMESRDS